MTHGLDGCPERPRTDRPEDLGFTRQRMVRWFGPQALLQTRAVPKIASLVGAFGGRRELQAALTPPPEYSYSERPEVWIDFVADSGDGCHSTYAVASLLRSDLSFQEAGATVRTERGHLLVMGGDQVYPSAGAKRYRDHLVGPYRAALPCTPEPHPHLFAIPGNHDWYDELTSFLDVFCRGRWIGGWQTRQSRSYFALQLPHRWWLWGVDIALEELVDAPQTDFFSHLASARLRPGDHVILVTAKPAWVHSWLRGDEGYKADLTAERNLQFVERELIEANGAVLAVALSGDLHHYARYERDDGGRQKITAGGGGAYLYPTHHLPAEVGWLERGAVAMYRRAAVDPEVRTSRRLSSGCLWMAVRNPGFTAMAGALYVLLGWIVQFSLRVPGDGVTSSLGHAEWGSIVTGLLRSPGGAVVSLVMILALMGFADAPTKTGKAALGLVHAASHLSLVAMGILVAARVAPIGSWFVPAFLVVVFVVGGLAAASLMGVYLFVTHKAFGSHPNEVFAAQHIRDHKGFLRMRLSDDGTLTIFPVALDRVPGRWRLRAGEPRDPWFEPADGGVSLRPRLIEPPIVVRGPSAAPSG